MQTVLCGGRHRHRAAGCIRLHLTQKERLQLSQKWPTFSYTACSTACVYIYIYTQSNGYGYRMSQILSLCLSHIVQDLVSQCVGARMSMLEAFLRQVKKYKVFRLCTRSSGTSLRTSRVFPPALNVKRCL